VIDLSRFSATKHDPRQYLRKPWKRGEWVYATNGHLCVRVPADSMPDVAECSKAPPAQNLFQKHIEQRECDFLLMPPLKAVNPCKTCDGKGVVMARECSSCDDGTFDRDGYTYDCQFCEGSAAGPGWVETHGEHGELRPCNTCDGLGADMRANRNVALGDSTYSLVYLSWLAALPQVRVCPGSPAEVSTADQVPAVLIFDGGQALLMPRRD
jgi:hypothetical protein